MVQLGQYPAPKHTIAHLSDPHLLAGGRPLYGAADTVRTLAHGLERLVSSAQPIEAIVVTGDLADLGEPDAYRRLRAEVDPVAAQLGARMVWVMGNHDERAPFSELMLDQAPSEHPQDAVYEFGGLRIVALDSSVPGYHHGALDDAQLDWLAGVLAEPAPDGTVIALHHPPVPSPVELMAVIELKEQHRLERVVRGTDVRCILGGHLHYSTHSMFAGVPVSVAGATCYSLDIGAPLGTLSGVDGGQSVNLVQFYEDRVVHSVAPITDGPQISGFSENALAALAAMTANERIEAFSNKRSTFNLAEVESSGPTPAQ